MRSILAAMTLAVLIIVPANAEASPRHKTKAVRAEATTAVLLRRLIAQNEKLARQSEKVTQELADIKKRIQPNAVMASADPQEPVRLGNPLLWKSPMPLPAEKSIAGYGKAIAHSAKLADLTPGLRVKVAEILRYCNSKITSGFRKGARVAGSGRASLHSIHPSEAADMQGDPKCIYAHLKNWPGGYSIDYDTVRCRGRPCPHVHISLSSSGRERGARFVHHGSSRRYAARGHRAQSQRYAVRQDRPVVWEQHAVAR